METQLWAIGVKGDSNSAALKSAVQELAQVSTFKVPTNLRVGTLDSLMSLSDDLGKMDILAEATVGKMYKQLVDLRPNDPEPTISGVPVVPYTCMQWEWDEAKFQLKTPLRELSESISLRISSLDEELKIKMTEMNVLKGSLQTIERKTQGNLMVRGLADLISEEDAMVSEYMISVYVVVQKGQMKDFEGSFERMATYVVPRSAKLLFEDTEYGLYRVIIFKKSLDEFKASAREKRYTMREFTYDEGAVAAEAAKKQTDEAEYARLKGMLSNWCQINYSECYIMTLHLKAVRVFVECVLRYGLSPGYGGGMAPNFKAFLLQPKKGQTEKLRKVLAGLYSGNAAMIGDGDEETVIPGATGEFYPYVYTSIETEFAQAA